jgi:hypothetical protein
LTQPKELDAHPAGGMGVFCVCRKVKVKKQEIRKIFRFFFRAAVV